MLDGLATTVMVAGVVDADETAESQLPPATATDTGFATLLLTLTVCTAAGDPLVRLKLSDEVLRVILGTAPVTLKTTRMVSGLLETPLAVIVMAAV
jgi:hypothetical protein